MIPHHSIADPHHERANTTIGVFRELADSIIESPAVVRLAE